MNLRCEFFTKKFYLCFDLSDWRLVFQKNEHYKIIQFGPLFLALGKRFRWGVFMYDYLIQERIVLGKISFLGVDFILSADCFIDLKKDYVGLNRILDFYIVNDEISCESINIESKTTEKIAEDEIKKIISSDEMRRYFEDKYIECENEE